MITWRKKTDKYLHEAQFPSSPPALPLLLLGAGVGPAAGAIAAGASEASPREPAVGSSVSVTVTSINSN